MKYRFQTNSAFGLAACQVCNYQCPIKFQVCVLSTLIKEILCHLLHMCDYYT